MSRLILLLLVIACPADAEPASPVAGFEPALAAEVYATALAFMAPRTLEPVPVPQLATWGLRGLTALDPELSTEIAGTSLVLAFRDRILATRPVPEGADPAAWARVAADLARAAWPASAALRRAGTEGIIQSFFDELFNHLDPYSRYVGPTEAQQDRGRRSGTAGAGLTLAGRRGAVLVTAAIDDGAGAEAGIRVGDRITAVDGRSTRGQDAATVAGWIAGAEGTLVRIEWRGGDGRVRGAEVERATVPPETVASERVGSLLFVRVSVFSRRTDQRLAREIARGLSGPRPIQGLVLDLRGNRGGLLRQAVAAANLFLAEGVVVVTSGRDPKASRIWRSAGGEPTEGVPVVILVDGRTASAAEILAAALADRGRGVVVGSSTLGKGLVQTIAPMPDGGELFVTWSRVLAPRLWPIQGLGVLPQVCTSLGQAELERELQALLEGRQPLADALARHEQARAPLPLAETLAIRGACPAAEGRDADAAAARFLIGHPGAYASALRPPLRETPAQAGGP